MSPARRLVCLLALSGVLAAPGAALAAHKPYLLPFGFAPERDSVGVEAAMVEDNYFVPDFAIRGGGPFVVTAPDGSTSTVAPADIKAISVADIPLPTDGTYRISTGERAGRSGQFVQIDGVWRPYRPGGEPGREGGPVRVAPEGAPIMESKGYLVAETFVSRGAPTPVKPRGSGFELEPLTHPNEVFLDEGFAFRSLVDGAPVANVSVTAYRAGEAYEQERTVVEATTGDDGKATLNFPRPGVYLLLARYPAPSPGAAPAARSWTYTLTLEVTD